MKRAYLPVLILVLIAALVGASAMARKELGQKGWLGVYTQSVDYDMAKAFDLEVQYGAVINEVVEDSPAEKAGLADGDVIIALNGEKVTDADDLTDLMVETSPGDRIELTIVRDGKEQTLAVEVGETPVDRDFVWFFGDDADLTPLPKVERPFLGVSLDDLSGQLGDYFGVAEGRGALVTEVEENSPAQKAGLKAGDVITEIDGEKVAEADDVVEILDDHKAGDQVSITAVRDRRAGRYTAEIGSREMPSFGHYSFFGPDKAAIKVPKLRGLYLGDADADDGEYGEAGREFEKEMRELGRELSRMKFEFQGFDREEFRKEMQELREELKQLKKELQDELRQLEQDKQ